VTGGEHRVRFQGVIGDVLQPTHLLFILAVALLVLGPKKLPEVGRSLGKGIRDFRNAMSGVEEHTNLMSSFDADPPSQPAATTPAPAEHVPETATAVFSPEPVTAALPLEPSIAEATVASDEESLATATATLPRPVSGSPRVEPGLSAPHAGHGSEPEPSEYAD
jgi:sec-independent protein translocase protein TatA